MIIKICANCYYRMKYDNYNNGCNNNIVKNDLYLQYYNLPDNFGCIHWKENIKED